jgi:hypothetical protein
MDRLAPDAAAAGRTGLPRLTETDVLSFLVRILGLVLFALGMVTLVADGIRSIAASAVLLTPLSATWKMVDAGSFDAAVVWLGGHSPVLAAWVAGPLTAVPTLVVASLLGIALMIAGRQRDGRRRRQIL